MKQYIWKAEYKVWHICEYSISGCCHFIITFIVITLFFSYKARRWKRLKYNRKVLSSKILQLKIKIDIRIMSFYDYLLRIVKYFLKKHVTNSQFPIIEEYKLACLGENHK